MLLKKPITIITAALILGWSADFLFYRQASLGISFPVFILLLLGVLLSLGRVAHVKAVRHNLWLVIPLLAFATMVFVRANLFLTVVNILTSLALIGFILHFYATGWFRNLGLIGYPIVLIQTGLATLYRAGPLISASGDLEAVREHTRHGLLPVFRGFLIALPVLALFTCFLASADLVFASYVTDFLELAFLENIIENTWHILLILITAWLLAGGIAYALARSETTDIEDPVERAIFQTGRRIPFGFVEGVTLLTLVNILFLAFVAIQFTYLFGGLANIQLDGYTYAEYARQGFFELVMVSLLTLALILGLFWIMRRNTPQQVRIFNALSTLMVGMVIIMLISAFQRLLLYEAAFGYTELRLYSHVFMIWLAITLVWFLVTLWWRNTRFAIGALMAGFGFLITLNLINPDAFIVRQNIARYLVTGTFGSQTESGTASRDYARDLDIDYFDGLSDDAVPALVSALDQVSGEEKQRLQQGLRRRLTRLEDEYLTEGWPVFHLSRQRAYGWLRVE